MKHFGSYAILFVLTLALAGCGGKTKTGEDAADGKNGKDGGSTVDHSSPAAVAESFKSAMAEKDWTTAVACMDAESQDTFIGALTISAYGAIAFSKDKSKTQSFEELFKKHGVDQKSARDGFKVVKDKGALVADIIDWIEKNMPTDKKEKGPASISEQFSQTEFSEFKSEGDTATAKVTSPTSRKKVDTAYFKKIDGKWYVDLATYMKKSMEKKAPPFPKKT